jgi:acylglycerol lipase
LVDPNLGFELMTKSPKIDKKLLFYENMWHAVWAEEEIHEIIPQVCSWLKERIH